MRVRPLAVALLLPPLLAGCIKFGSEPPPSLLRLTPAVAPDPQASRSGAIAQAIAVEPPSVPQELRTNRVPVRTGDTQVAYLKDAQWVEMPGAMFARLLSDTIAARTGRVVLDPDQLALEPGVRLTGQLQTFGIDADAMEATVVYDAALTRAPGQVETRRFTARSPIAAVDVANAGPALNQAANQIAAEVAAWIGG